MKQTQSVKIHTVARPYLLTFHSSGHTYPLTSDEAQRLLDAYPARRATSQSVVLMGHNSSHAYDRTTIRPATRGGGPALLLIKEAV
jgi:hypothetical protein